MKTDQELDDKFDGMLFRLEQAQSYSEFEAVLLEYLSSCYNSVNLADSTVGLRILPVANISLAYLFAFFSKYLDERFRDGSRMSDFKFLIYIEVFSHLPDELPAMKDHDRVRISTWLFRFLSVEGCQWMFFEMYSDLEDTKFSKDWHFMLQGRNE